MRTFRGTILALTVVTALASVSLTAASAADEGTAEDAAREIAAARERANVAADAWAEAQSRLELLGDQRDDLEDQVKALQKRVDALQSIVEKVAVNRYIGSGTSAISLLGGTLAPTEQAQTQVLVGIVNEASAGSFDDYTELRKQLDAKVEEAEQATRDWEAAQRDFQAKQDAANEEVERLKLIEKDRLQDEAVQRALEAQRQKAIEAEQKAAAELLRKDQAAANEAMMFAEGAGSDGGDEGLGSDTGNAASSGSSGGRTGGGGSGGRAVIIGIDRIYGVGDQWVCPIQGVTGFADTWGAPRSGGRSHQGVDMISPKGTPVVAVVSGVATPKTNTLGGTVIWLTGDDGNKYYYAHLDGYANLGIVEKGAVIGFVGETGNAIYSTAHLHFEIHPGGGAAVNPYPTVAAYCA